MDRPRPADGVAPTLSHRLLWEAKTMVQRLCPPDLVPTRTMDAAARGLALLGHSVSITAFSPLSNLYQVTTMYGLPFHRHIGLVLRIVPAQVALRLAQIHAGTAIKQHSATPWLSFGLLGVLQGAVYGHANVFFAAHMGATGSTASPRAAIPWRRAFRGPVFAAKRDVLSQGLPFVLGDHVRTGLLPEPIDKWASLAGLSLASTVASHPFHLLQVLMQTQPHMTHWAALRHLVHHYGPVRAFTTGVTSRMGLLLVTVALNEVFLKAVWEELEA